MSDNLLCISFDALFCYPVWATISGTQDKEMLKKKQVFVTFYTQMNSLSDAEVITKLQQLTDQDNQAYMFESTTFFVAFGPPLEVLQQKEHVPFKEQLVDVQQCTKDKPPENLSNIKKRPEWNIFFNKDPFDREDTGNYSYEKLVQEFNDLKSKVEEYGTNLDKRQLEAVEQALRNRVTLIQGPPGTGKSYVGEKLLQFLLSCLPTESGPILVVTYKNFALDHFLSSCLKSNPDLELARVGRGSNTENIDKNLEACKLDQLISETKCSSHYELKKSLTNQLNAMQQKIKDCIKELRCANRFSNLPHVFVKEANDKHLKSLLKDKEFAKMPRDNTELLEKIKESLKDWLPSKDEFLKLGRVYEKLGNKEVVKTKIGSDDEDGDGESSEIDPSFERNERFGAFDNDVDQLDSTDEKVDLPDVSKASTSIDDQDVLPDIPVERLGNFKSILNAGDIKNLITYEKIQMVYALQKQYYKTVSDRFKCLAEDVAKKCKTRKELKDQESIEVLKKCRVIGMTVSGAAIRASWLEAIQPSVMIVEEAAEILEPQLVAIIPSSVKHLIMIGDQEQLKPQVSHYKLGRVCKLTTSMFERLIKGGLDHTQLNKQGRMTDDLSELVRRLDIYTEYKTRQKVVKEKCKLPKCLSKSMYFYSHKKEEDEQPGTHSRYNDFEAKKVIEFAKLLCGAKVHPSKITILCSYLAQVKHIKTLMAKEGSSSSVQDVAVTTIDSFQGKENDIIILSLVRNSSSPKAKIGYLASINRICVAVSRARCGLYLFGNKKLLKDKSKNGWEKVIKLLEDKGCVGERLPLVNEIGECTEADGPAGNAQTRTPGPQYSTSPSGNTTYNVNIYGQVDKLQIGDNSIMITTDPGSQNEQQQPQSRSGSSSTAAPPTSPEAPSIQETNKIKSPSSTERLSTEEIRKIHGLEPLDQQSQSTEETSDAPGPQTTDSQHTEDTGEPQELSFHDPQLQSSGNPLEMQLGNEAREMSFTSLAPTPLQETNDIDKRQPQQDSNPPVNKPVQEDTSVGTTVLGGASVNPTVNATVQEGVSVNPTAGATVQEDAPASVPVGMPLQEEKDNAAFQETNTNTKQ